MANIVQQEIAYAPSAFRLLNGCFCIYKPIKKGFKKTRTAIVEKISNELNSMECRPVRDRIEITGEFSCQNENDFNVEIKPNLADHPLVSGPRYSPKQIGLKFVNNPGWYSSGIMVGFIGPSAYKANKFIQYNLPRLYEIKGEFGLASLNYRDDGKVRLKSTYKHINGTLFQKILSKIEAAQRSLMFKAVNVDIRSEEAYQIALNGLSKYLTNRNTMPIVTAIKPISFNLPNFTIQIECFNEQEIFLAELINEIGIALKSAARCTGIRLIQLGPFTVEHSLLQKHWTLENLIENIYYCNEIFDKFEKEQSKAIS